MKIKISGVERVLERVRRVSEGLREKQRLLLERLAEIGVSTAQIKFLSAEYDGDNDVKVSTEWVSDSRLNICAAGKSVLFIEFGSGVIGDGHPKAQERGYGPGSWSDSERGKGHWQNPGGWYYAHGLKSIGNRPARAMYDTAEELRAQIARIAREVFENE